MSQVSGMDPETVLFLISPEQRAEWRRTSALGKGKVEAGDDVEAGQGRPGLGGWDLCD